MKPLFKKFDITELDISWLDVFSDEPHLFFLDSSAVEEKRGRYSFLGFDPFEVVKVRGKNSLGILKKKFDAYRCDDVRLSCSPLTSGIVGFLSYDYGLHQESIPLSPKEKVSLPDCCFGFYDCILTIDHFTKTLYITSSGLPEKDLVLREEKAFKRIEYVEQKLRSFRIFSENRKEKQSYDKRKKLNITSNISKKEYVQSIEKISQHISNGDIYQANFAQRFQIDATRDEFCPTDMYKNLCNFSPVSFGGYFDFQDGIIMSNSPERFLHLSNRKVTTRPMKGTRRRTKDEDENVRLKKELTESAKDRAELLMITDLERNDLGRVCEYGSIEVVEQRTIEEYQTVFQATSLIEGVLRKNHDAFDLLKACFPGGSITGCPKIRAMQIIEETEKDRRGIYTGIFGYISFSGDMDFNILIRTLLFLQSKIYFHTGGGIVADSTAENEYEETLIKAKAMIKCLQETFLETTKDSDVEENVYLSQR